MKNETPPNLATYARLLQYVKPYWPLLVISISGDLILAATQPLAAWWLGWFIDAYPKAHDIWRMGITYAVVIPLSAVAIYFVRGLGNFIGDYYLSVVARNVINNIRCQMFSRLLRLPSAYFDGNNIGHIIARVVYNVEQVSNAGAKSAATIFTESFSVIALLCSLLYTNWQMTLIFMCCIPPIALIIKTTNKLLVRYSRRIQHSMGDVTQTLSENINGYRVSRVFGGIQYEEKRFTDVSFYNLHQGLKLTIVSAITSPLIQWIVAIAMAFIVWLLMGVLQPMNTKSLISFMTMIGLLAKPLKSLIEVNGVIQKGLTAAQNVFEFMDESPEVDKGTQPLIKAHGLIEFKNVTFSYTNHTAVLNNISFTAQPGQTIALVGRSGSGKSTLVSLLPRFYENKYGQILLDGVPITDYRLTDLRNQIALVTQQVTLFNDTIANNIAYGALRGASEIDIIDAAKRAHAMEFIDKLPNGLHTMIGDNGALLSGGQRQRLAIARAILKNAPILILDEATSALDSESEHHIQAALTEVMKDRTTFVIAHRLSTIENADMILVMDKGQIVEMGSHRELLAKGHLYAQLHKMQFKDEAAIEV
jgi:subfamily B ATP-binding cassette protein MsbA